MNPQQEILNKCSLVGILDKIEEDKAIIKLNDGQEIIWSRRNLPQDIKEGEVIRIKLFTSDTERDEREKVVKKLLEEILKREE